MEIIAESNKNSCKNIYSVDNCPIRNILDRLGDKWSTLILLSLAEKDTMRFSELTKEIPDISQKMLTVTLRTLETMQLVTRTIYPQIPPKVEYSLTPRGKTLIPHIQGLVLWAKQQMMEV